MMKQIVAVYNGEGVSAVSELYLSKRLKQFLPSKDIISVGAEDIISGKILAKKNTIAIVFPGGHSRFFQKNLGNIGNQKIRDFVHKGGRYLGICGGAYYAASEIEFKGEELEFPKRKGGLSLFKGLATGSLPELTNGLYFTDEYKTANVVRVNYELTDEKGEKVPREAEFFYHGGPKFEPDGKQPYEILGQYTDCSNDIAALVTPFGSGRAVLVGTHPELYSGLFLYESVEWCKNNNQKLEKHAQDMFEKLYDSGSQERGRNYLRYILRKLLEVE
jgi:biotin--protein ligase